MMQTEMPPTRSVTLVLPEAEWRALREAEPDAVAWLQRQVRDRLSIAEQRKVPALALGEDEY